MPDPKVLSLLQPVALACAVLLAGCANGPLRTETSAASAQRPSHTSQNSLDWTGVYMGSLPCADCEQIDTWLKLNDDYSYELRTRYLGRSDEIFRELGNFQWNAAGSMVILGLPVETGAKFRVEEGRLVQLNVFGEPIEGKLADRYVLQKIR